MNSKQTLGLLLLVQTFITVIHCCSVLPWGSVSWKLKLRNTSHIWSILHVGDIHFSSIYTKTYFLYTPSILDCLYSWNSKWVRCGSKLQIIILHRLCPSGSLLQAYLFNSYLCLPITAQAHISRMYIFKNRMLCTLFWW